MPATWLLDVFAALMLATAALSGTRLVVAARSRSRGPAGADGDVANLLMGIAMAGMLAPSVTTLTPGAWETTFAALTAWFGWRAARDTRVHGIRSLASGHCAMHALHCGAMVYLFAAATESGGMAMTGMGSPAPSLEYPTLALAFASALTGYTAWDIGRLSSRPRRRAVAAKTTPTTVITGRIAMGMTMAFMLLIMI